MEDERIPKKVLNGKFYDTRPVGKTKKKDGRLLEGYFTDPRNSRMEETSRREREEWKCLLRGARAQRWLQCHRWVDGWRPRHVSYYLSSQTRISLPLSSFSLRHKEKLHDFHLMLLG
jgi:hypothetical protein